jgi:hypothetical protein
MKVNDEYIRYPDKQYMARIVEIRMNSIDIQIIRSRGPRNIGRIITWKKDLFNILHTPCETTKVKRILEKYE